MSSITTRSLWAEKVAADIASRPLVREFVFSNMRFLDNVEREVCDLVLALRGNAIVGQIKAQEDPLSRSHSKLASWVAKNAKRAASQLRGTIRTILERDVWCQHPRRGRVEFSRGDLKPVQGVVLVENLGPRIMLPAELPLVHSGVPIHYFSLNDFLNVVDQLRSFPEIIAYLDQRRSLPVDILGSIGGERAVCLYYLLNQGEFRGRKSYEEVSALVRSAEALVRQAIKRKERADRDAYFIEYVADSLATRSESYLEDLPEDLAAQFDRPDRRRNYLMMQEELSDLGLSERRLLGRQFLNVCDGCETSPLGADMRYAAAHFDTKPGFVYVVVSSKGLPRVTVLRRGIRLLCAAAAFYAKERGLLIADRDKESFEVFLLANHQVTDDGIADGKALFGRLGQYDFAGNLVPCSEQSGGAPSPAGS